MIRLARLLGRLFRWGVYVYAGMAVAMVAWTFLWPDPDLDALPQSDAIVCLGGGMSPDGTLAAAVLTRIERCVQLYEAGLAPIVIFTGGTARPQGPDASSQMALYAETLGLPPDRAMNEPRAQSTLQNALFSLGLAPDKNRIIVVTEAFHLPRSYASFKWAAWELERPLSVHLAMSEPVRRDPVTDRPNLRILARESLAIWFNLVRAAGYSFAPNPDLNWLH